MKLFLSVCIAVCMLCAVASAQDSDYFTQQSNSNYPTQEPEFSPFDRDVHVGLYYGWSDKLLDGDEEDAKEFSSLGLTFMGYGEFWGGGVGISYLMEEDFSESNILVINDVSNSTISMLSLDLLLGVRFPVYFIDIFINGGLTFASLTVNNSYSVQNIRIFSEEEKENSVGAFIEVGGRLYITRNLNVNITARYAALEISVGETDYDMGGASILAGLGYAFY